jgi:hypothetical protein
MGGMMAGNGASDLELVTPESPQIALRQPA